MDREDIMYALGGVLVSVGAGIASLPAGIACLGAFVVLPPLLSLFRAKGPQK